MEVGGEEYRLRLTTRAMMAIENKFDAAMQDVFSKIEGSGGRVSMIVGIMSEIMENGDGCGEEAAQALIDKAGFAEAGEAIGRTVEAAFGVVAKDTTSGNGKSASRKK